MRSLCKGTDGKEYRPCKNGCEYSAGYSFTNYKRGQTTGCMGAVMRYTMQDKTTECDGQQLVTDINCQPESVYADFRTTKRLHHKTDGVLFYHMVQSFPKGKTVDPVTVHAAAPKLAEYYEGYEVLVCTHTDREHIYSHFVINSVNFNTGKKLHIAKEQLQELRQRNDQVCMEFSFPVFNPTNRKEKCMVLCLTEKMREADLNAMESKRACPLPFQPRRNGWRNSKTQPTMWMPSLRRPNGTLPSTN